MTAQQQAVIRAVDFYAWIKPDTIERRKLGIGFIQPVADASLVLIGIKSTAGQTAKLTAVLDPFDGIVWILITVS